jgi:hypothetical protein
MYQVGGKYEFGIVQSIFMINLEEAEPWIIIHPFENKYTHSRDATDGNFRSILSLLKILAGSIVDTKRVISPKMVNSLCAYRKLGDNVFGLSSNGILICPLNYSSLLN